MDGTQTTRRTFLNHAAAGVGAAVVGGELAGAPAAAGRGRDHAGPGPAGRPALSARQHATLIAWCETLVPGARAAGVGEFVAAQLAKPDDDALLMIRYLDWPPPYGAFYRAGLDALEDASRRAHSRRFTALAPERRGELLGRLLAGDARWDGPPFFLFYLATRADGVDVVYGMPRGFARIGAPYRPLVPPPARW